MIYTSLRHFIERATERKRIGFGDVRRLARDILPDGITSREEADLLLALDRTATKVDSAWSDWLVAALVDFVVWGERPTGTVEAETAAWLNAALTGEGASKRAARILRAVMREAEQVDPSLLCPGPRRMKQAAPIEPELGQPEIVQVVVETEAPASLTA